MFALPQFKMLISIASASSKGRCRQLCSWDSACFRVLADLPHEDRHNLAAASLSAHLSGQAARFRTCEKFDRNIIQKLEACEVGRRHFEVQNALMISEIAWSCIKNQDVSVVAARHATPYKAHRVNSTPQLADLQVVHNCLNRSNPALQGHLRPKLSENKEEKSFPRVNRNGAPILLLFDGEVRSGAIAAAPRAGRLADQAPWPLSHAFTAPSRARRAVALRCQCSFQLQLSPSKTLWSVRYQGKCILRFASAPLRVPLPSLTAVCILSPILKVHPVSTWTPCAQSKPNPSKISNTSRTFVQEDSQVSFRLVGN